MFRSRGPGHGPARFFLRFLQTALEFGQEFGRALVGGREAAQALANGQERLVHGWSVAQIPGEPGKLLGLGGQLLRIQRVQVRRHAAKESRGIAVMAFLELLACGLLDLAEQTR